MYDSTYPVDLATGALVLCKDRTTKKTPGKWAKRRKQDRPLSKKAQAAFEPCDKEVFKSMEKAKWAVERARRSRYRANLDGVESVRREIRVYECFRHSSRVFHLTSVEMENYNEKFDASKRGEYCRAA